MEQIKSLADEIRNTMAKPAAKEKNGPGERQREKKEKVTKAPLILEELQAYDNSNNKSMLHTRFDKDTVKMLNHFKLATNIDVTKLVAFAVQNLFEQNPELKTIIKQFFQNIEL
jgi:hypothetical protein